MITREELLLSKAYWLAKLQGELYHEVACYLQKNKLSKAAFAAQLGVSKGYISQLLNGGFDHKISKLIELSLAIGKAPVLEFVDLAEAGRGDEAKMKRSKSLAHQQVILNMVAEAENVYEKKLPLKPKASLKKSSKNP